MRLFAALLLVGCSSSTTVAPDAGVDAGPPVCGAPDPCIDGPPVENRLRMRPADVLANQIGDAIARVVRWDEPTLARPLGPFATSPEPTDAMVGTRFDALRGIATDEAARIADECGDADCIDGRVATLIGAAFARPLDLDETSAIGDALGARSSAEVESVLLQGFLSPDAWVIREVGAPLSPGDRARRFAAAFWRSGPDGALLRAFASGEAPERIVDRLLGDARSRRGFERFHGELLGPTLGEGALVDRMVEETDAYLESIVSNPDATYADWIAAPHTFVDDALAEHYGLPDRPGPELSRVSLDPSRATLLAHGSITSGRSIPLRGAFVLERLLCRTVPSPPAAEPMPPPPSDGTTGRERYEALLEPPCVGCHATFDPFGFALEAYDSEGGFRSVDSGRPIDDGYPETCIGTTLLPEGSGAGALGSWLAAEPDAHACFARQWTRYLTQADPGECQVDELGFDPESGRLRDLHAALVLADATRSVARDPIGSHPFVASAGDLGLSAIDATIARIDEWHSAETSDADRALLGRLRDQWALLRMRLTR
ncbi:MAG: DUF1588 domain-containing protein [Deltaproteobacteria bacterium]|nr:DUF1588 domain-containing protein [Deltaproteobacteria bacterium]